MYQVIFYDNENSIIDSEYYDNIPTTEDVDYLGKKMMYYKAQVYYDKYETNDYDIIICEITAD